MAELGEYARAILDILRDSIFRDVADQVDEEIAAGKVQFVRERKVKKAAETAYAVFDIIPQEELPNRGRKSNLDVRIAEYSTIEADDLAKEALSRLFIEPARIVNPLIKTLGLGSPDAVRFAMPDSVDRQTTLKDYISVLTGPEAQALEQALKDD